MNRFRLTIMEHTECFVAPPAVDLAQDFARKVELRIARIGFWPGVVWQLGSLLFDKTIDGGILSCIDTDCDKQSIYATV